MKKLMKKLLKTQSGRFVSGLLALILTTVVVVGAGSLNFLKADVTAQRVMTIDPAAEEIVRAVNEEVQIYYLTTESEKDVWLDELLERYESLNEKITYQMINSATEGSRLVISSQKRTVSITSEHFYQVSYDMLAYYYYGELIVQEQIFKADEEIANALFYVIRDDMPVVYMLSGHGETVLGSLALEELQRNNIDVQTLTIDGSVPENADLVMICAPMTDIAQEEADALLSYVQAGGKLVLMTDYTMTNMPNISSVMAYYGMQSKYGLTLDMTEGYCYSTEVPNYLTPAVTSHGITDALLSVNTTLLLPMCGALERNEVARNSLTVTELMTTSEEAYLKNPLMATSIEKEDGDETGAFTLAMAAEEGDSRVVWFASATLFEDENVQYSNETNLYIMDGIREYLLPQTAKRIFIEDGNLLSNAMSVPAQQQVLVYIVLFVPALIMLIAGIVLSPRKSVRRTEE